MNKTKESQSKYMMDVSHCVKGILDEEIYELLMKIFENN